MKFYISGPMTGIKDFNYPEFIKAEKSLIDTNIDVFSPHNAPKLDSWQEYMRYDIAELTKCTHIMMLDGWRKSKGAKIEHRIARDLGMVIVYNKKRPYVWKGAYIGQGEKG